MAKKNKNKRRGPQPTTLSPPLPKKRDEKPHHKHGQPIRETVESLVIAFVLAFLFRTFQAEAFVIPTGSMAPTLMGRHEDVHCPACGLRYKVSDSNPSEDEVSSVAKMYRQQTGNTPTPRKAVELTACVAGHCPNCRSTMLFEPLNRETASVEEQPAYSGDRILVNKYLYSFTDPQRWDIVVFKYPGDPVQNYIKRLVGLPGEELRIQHGDVFARQDGEAYEVLHKPDDKVLAMRQLVHSTSHDPAKLYEAGYPLRWQFTKDNWSLDKEVVGNLVKQTYQLKSADKTAWLQYSHIPPSEETWRNVGKSTAGARPMPLKATPQLITDFNAYNTGVKLYEAQRRSNVALQVPQRGLHWVGDLILEADVAIESEQGVVALQLVEAGCRYLCEIDVATGQATVSATPFGQDAPSELLSSTGQTRVKGPGKRHLRWANVDDQLLLWVDDRLVAFDKPLTYDPTKLIGPREDLIPRWSDDEPGDLAPAAIGGRGLDVSVNRLAVYRDIYYIAEKDTRQSPKENPPSLMSDFPLRQYIGGSLHVMAEGGPVPLEDLLTDPTTWDAYRARRAQHFSLKSLEGSEDLFFVMGDNSAASSDARLWSSGNGSSDKLPGGPYLERKLLIGKAVCVYWPHSFGRVPGTPIPFPFFPNFGDMRLVR